MFEFLFKYPPTVFARGDYLFLSPWPVWWLGALLTLASLLLAWTILRRLRHSSGRKTGWRPVLIWLLQSALAGLLLLLLWRPAISVATLKPQQNVVAVLIDDSRSMGVRENGRTRLEEVVAALNSGTLAALRRMRPRNRGTIVQVGSALAYRAIPLQAPYCGANRS